MSSEKRLCLRSHTNKRRSFEWRICDDLSVEILKYLPFEDKLKLECVSKQFQRTVFNKCHKLSINSRFVYRKRLNMDAIKSVLKKCPNINEIKLKPKYKYDLRPFRFSPIRTIVEDLVFFNVKAPVYRKLILLIDKYCKRLVKINLKLLRDSDVCHKLIKKFDPKCLTLKLDTNFDQSFVQTLSPIKELKLKNVCSMKDEEISFLKTVKGLNIVTIDIYDPDINDLENFVENNDRLKCLNIFSHNLKSDKISVAFDHISKLQNLVEFGFYNYDGFDYKVLINGLIQMSRNCPHLKMIGLRFGFNESNKSKIDYLFSSLRRFKQLRKLRLSLFNDNNDMKTQFLELFSCSALKGLEKLTYFYLRLNTVAIDEKILTDIDVNLPNLQYLRLDHAINHTEWSADILSRLTKLQSIYFSPKNESFRKLMEEKLIQNCRKIEIIGF